MCACVNMHVHLHMQVLPANLPAAGRAEPLTTLRLVVDGRSKDEPVVVPVKYLGQWPKLGHLYLGASVKLMATPAQLASQLQKLSCLTYFGLHANVAGSHEGILMGAAHRRHVLQPLVDCIVGLSSLRGLTLSMQQLTGQQKATLAVLTRLSELRID